MRFTAARLSSIFRTTRAARQARSISPRAGSSRLKRPCFRPTAISPRPTPAASSIPSRSCSPARSRVPLNSRLPSSNRITLTSSPVRKIVLITGASRGIGAATARLAAADGYDVAVNYRRDKAAADMVVADIESAGRRAVAIQADVAKEEEVERLFATVDTSLGRLTHLVCNTGITGPLSRIEALPTDAAREVLDVNVFGAFLCARAAVARISTRQI